jgi:two-component system LytT family sensor kinase
MPSGLASGPAPGRIAPLQVLVVATLLGLIASGQHNVTMRVTEGPTDIAHALGMGMPYWYLWALFVPLVAAASMRFPLTRERWLASGAMHLGIAVLVTLVHAMLEIGVQHALGIRHSSFGIFTMTSLSRAFWQLPYDLLAYAAILGMVIALDSSRRYREGQLAAAAVSAELAEARLQALRTQLNPHFLFNAMNSIAMLVRKQENARAVTMIAGLSDLLRYVLEERPPDEVRLREELAFLNRYLAVEQERFSDRLDLSIRADPALLDAYVPNLVLQPLVENAIKHGMARRTASGRLVISAERLNGNLTLRVEDDGPGPGAAGPDPVGGLGLRNVRARLQQLYGAEHRLTLEPGREGGAVATVTLPFHLAPLAATRGIDG